MLKKAGIVVAAAAAGLLAVSPLAFAGESHKDWGHGTDVSSYEQNSEGFVNVSDTNVNVPVNICHDQVPVNVLGIQVPLNSTNIVADLTGALGLPALSPDSDPKAVRDGDTSLNASCNNAVAGDDDANS